MGEIKKVNFSIEHLHFEKHPKHQEDRSGKRLEIQKYGLEFHQKF